MKAVRWVLVAWTCVATVQLAAAHAKVVRADPAPGAVLRSAPRQVRVVFNEELAARGSFLVVVDGRGRRVDEATGGLDLDDLDRKTLVVRLKPLGPGRYTVRWQATSADDGYVARGQYTFTVRP
ncbi:MAG: copper resistance protein CopC [Armatimonadota bacterium]|nr:copper resistance protein CopC [Armatimonadota bacterium]MDW8156235.1 copper resistance protein CopC [Armatimonadota bacterium]